MQHGLLHWACFACNPAHAGPADYVYTPIVEKGEKEIDFKFGTADSDPRKSVGTLGLGYDANDWPLSLLSPSQCALARGVRRRLCFCPGFCLG